MCTQTCKPKVYFVPPSNRCDDLYASTCHLAFACMLLLKHYPPTPYTHMNVHGVHMCYKHFESIEIVL